MGLAGTFLRDSRLESTGPARGGRRPNNVSQGDVEGESVRLELVSEKQSPCAASGRARWPSSGPAEALGDIGIGGLDLLVGGAGVGELIPRVGVLQVSPQARHLGREVIVPVLLGHDLQHRQQRWREGTRQTREKELVVGPGMQAAGAEGGGTPHASHPATPQQNVYCARWQAELPSFYLL